MNIFVGNLSFDVSGTEIEKLFKGFGDVASAVIVPQKGKKTPKSRGFGFVEMPDESQARAAIAALNGKEFMGRVLKVNTGVLKKKSSREVKWGRRPGLKGKISPGLGRNVRMRLNPGKRLSREIGVPGGKPKASLSLGVNPEEVVLSPGKGLKASQDPGRGLRVDLNLGRNPRKRISLGVRGKISPGLGRNVRMRLNPGKRLSREIGVPGGKPKASLSLGVNPEEVVLSPGKGLKASQDPGRGLRVDLNLGRNPRKRISLGVRGKISPGLGRNVRMRLNPGKRLSREIGVPGGKPKASLSLGVNPEEVVLSPGKGLKASQDPGRGLRVDLKLGRNPVESLSRGRNRREMLSLGAKAVSLREDPGLRAGKNRAKVKHRVIISALVRNYL